MLLLIRNRLYFHYDSVSRNHAPCFRVRRDHGGRCWSPRVKRRAARSGKQCLKEGLRLLKSAKIPHNPVLPHIPKYNKIHWIQTRKPGELEAAVSSSPGFRRFRGLGKSRDRFGSRLMCENHIDSIAGFILSTMVFIIHPIWSNSSLLELKQTCLNPQSA